MTNLVALIQSYITKVPLTSMKLNVHPNLYQLTQKQHNFVQKHCTQSLKKRRQLDLEQKINQAKLQSLAVSLFTSQKQKKLNLKKRPFSACVQDHTETNISPRSIQAPQTSRQSASQTGRDKFSTVPAGEFSNFMDTKATGICKAYRDVYNFNMGSSKQGKNLIAENSKNTVKELSITRKEYLNKTLFLEQRLLLDIEKLIDIFTKKISLNKMMRGDSANLNKSSLVKKFTSLERGATGLGGGGSQRVTQSTEMNDKKAEYMKFLKQKDIGFLDRINKKKDSENKRQGSYLNEKATIFPFNAKFIRKNSISILRNVSYKN